MLHAPWLRGLTARSHTAHTASSRRRRSTARRTISGRFSIEALENRLVLSTITVNTLADTVDTGPGVTSLRDAITAANSQPGDDIINFSVTGAINLTAPLPDLSSNIQIDGPGAASLTVRRDTGGDYRIFTVDGGETVGLDGLTISNGLGTFGGGVYNAGTLTLADMTLTGNSAASGGAIYNLGTLTMVSSTLSGNDGANGNANGRGGAISNDGTLTVEICTISGNSATFGGGISNGGALTVDRCTISGNSADLGGGIVSTGTVTVDGSTLSGNSAAYGGAIYNHNFGILNVDNSTLTGNSANNNGGGIYNTHGPLTTHNSTLTRNAASLGGGIYGNDGTNTLDNTIVAANFAPDEIHGAVASDSSHNLIGMDTNLSGISNGSNGNQIGTADAPINPMLGSLQDNGGPTATMALLPGSPAINAGDNSVIPAGVTTDQRGAGYARIDDGTVDIGASELVVVASPPFTFMITNLDDNGSGSLRQAILDANAHLGADIIQFASGVAGTITLTSGELNIRDDSLDIQGPGAGVVAISGNNTSRVFDVTANATISGLTISGGSADQGGGIYNAYGMLTVLNTTLSGNSAASGGAIYNAYGTLLVDSSTLTGNSAFQFGSGGGAIYNANYGTFTVVQNSILGDNTASYGGGIFNAGALGMSHMTFTGNSASAQGGGFYSAGTLTMDNSTFSGNHAENNSGGGEGGGIFNAGTLTLSQMTLSDNSGANAGAICNTGTLTLVNSTLSGNSAAIYFGGGIFNRGMLSVESSTFDGNSGTFGGGIAINGGTLTVDHSTFSGNSASVQGGGLYSTGTGTMAVHYSTLSDNSAAYGGGIYNNFGMLTVDNSTLSGNDANNDGGGIYNTHGPLTLHNSTLSGNAAGYGGSGGYGGGLYLNDGPSTLDNSIVAANSSDDIHGAVDGGSSHNLIGVDTNLSGISNGSNGNQIGTAAAPINAMLGSLQDNGGQTATMALLPGSPAINAGDNSLIPPGVTTDQRGIGYARIEDGTVDIGAVELVVVATPPSTFMVTNLDDSGPGSLRQAILDANAHLGADVIQFVPGLTGTITLITGELDISDDSLDIQGPGAGVITVSGNNASRVFDVTADATIGGLTIGGGSSDQGGGTYNAYGTLTVESSVLSGNSAASGGAIYNAHGRLVVDLCTFTGNSASQAGSVGGGIYNDNYGTTTVVQNSVLSDNMASYGGGIFNAGALLMSHMSFIGNSASAQGGGFYSAGTLTMDNSTFSGNHAENNSGGGEGGIFNAGTLTLSQMTLSDNSGANAGAICNTGTLTLVNSTLSGNSAAIYFGGGIFNRGTLSVESSTFDGNSARYFGGGIAINGGTLTVDHSTFSGNSASVQGGGLYSTGTGTMAVHYSTLSDNSAAYGGGIYNNFGMLTVDNSTLSGNDANNDGGGIFNSGTLTVEGSTFSSNSARAGHGGGIYGNDGTNTLNNTIVAANFAPDEIHGAVASGSSHNLIGVDTNLSGISNGGNGNQIGTAAAPINPMLGSLQDNGGPTATMALLPGSPAINAGDNSLIPAGVTTDQRGAGYARINAGTVDIGAVEFSVATTTVVTTDHLGGSTYGQTVTFTATVSATSARTGTPPGFVQFIVDGTSYGSAEALAGGMASLPLSSLSAGSHTIVAQYTSSSRAFLNSASDANFTVSVARAHLTVTADNKTMVYGGSQPALTYQITGFVNGETLATSGVSGTPSLATVSANSPVGTYAIAVGIGTLTAANYDFPAGNVVSGSLSITPATLTVTANNASRLYLAVNPALTVTITGFVNGDSSSVVSGAASLMTTATTASPVGIYPINVAQGTLSAADYSFALVNGTLSVTAADSIYVLNSSASGALSIAGNAGINLTGLLEVNSRSASAMQASSNATIEASSIQVVGGYSATGNGSFSPKPTTGLTPFADPLAGLPSPSTTGLTNFGALSLSGNSSKTINPGIYSQISVSGNASLTMNAGTYIIEGGGMTVSGNASLSGTGVFMFNAGSSYSYNATTSVATDGGNFGGIALGGSGKFNLTAATTGTYAGIVIDQARDNTRAVSLGGNATSAISSTVYAANALLTVSGDAQLAGSLVVGTLNLSGNVAMTQMAAGSDGSGDVAGIADTLLAGNLYVYVDNSSGGFSPDELARLSAAVDGWNTLLVPYSVTITPVNDRTLANLTIDSGTTSACGTAADGVLGCYNRDDSEITLLTGWNWYAGSDPTQIGAGQYDFQTTITHELGHALGLGHSLDPNSPMYESLGEGVADRRVSVADLNISDPPVGADPQRAAGFAADEGAPGRTASAGFAAIAAEASGQSDGASLLSHHAVAATVAWICPGDDAAKLTTAHDQALAAWNDDLIGGELFSD